MNKQLDDCENQSRKKEFRVKDLDTPIRADKYIAEYLHLFPRSQFKHRNVRIFLAGRRIKQSKQIQNGDTVTVWYEDEEIPPQLEAENIPITILYEDKDVIVVNKEAGMVVHPAKGNRRGTLVNALLYYCNGLAGRFSLDQVRPGIVHRLDKDTSGILIIAKSAEIRNYLSIQFKKRRVKKTYYAVCKGLPSPSSGTINDNIIRDPGNRKRFRCARSGGKKATTFYETIGTSGNYSLLRIRPITGRTHQIRVHLSNRSHPIVGDSVYSRKDQLHPSAGLMLHAASLQIRLPSREEASVFHAPLPGRFFDEFPGFDRFRDLPEKVRRSLK